VNHYEYDENGVARKADPTLEPRVAPTRIKHRESYVRRTFWAFIDDSKLAFLIWGIIVVQVVLIWSFVDRLLGN